MEEQKKETVYGVMAGLVGKLERMDPKDGRRTAALAALRDSVGKPLSEAEKVWPLIFEGLPEEFLGTRGRAIREERAIYTTLQLYALCMQGSGGRVTADDNRDTSIGVSLRAGRDPEDSTALDRRFNAMATADTFEELSYHLRQLIKVVRSRAVMQINFARLAEDLYRLQQGREHQQRLCFVWAKDYYFYKPADKEPEDGQ